MLRDAAVSLWESGGGRQAETLVDDWSREGGAHHVTWSNQNLASKDS